MLAQIAIAQFDRRNAITYARKLQSLKKDVRSLETLVRALIASADPVFHKRDIMEGSKLAKALKPDSIGKIEVGLVAVRGSLVLGEIDDAENYLKIALAANPSEPRLVAFNEQIIQQRKIEAEGIEQ